MAFDDDRLDCLSYEDFELNTEQEKALNSDLDPIEVEEEDIDEGKFQQIDCVYMIIDGAGVHWQCYPKHPDTPTITITTEYMDYNFIESLIGKIEKEEDEEDAAETP